MHNYDDSDEEKEVKTEIPAHKILYEDMNIHGPIPDIDNLTKEEIDEKEAQRTKEMDEIKNTILTCKI